MEPEKHCARCGRAFAWRKKWARDWDAVRYCSAACRAAKLDPTDLALEAALHRILAERAAGKTLCPSEAARAVGGEGWRDLMERTRMAARRLVARGEVRILQRGREVDPSRARGPIRVGHARST